MAKTLLLAGICLLGLLARSEGESCACRGWAKYGTFCFKVFYAPKTFFEASIACSFDRCADGKPLSRLAMFWTASQSKFIQGLMGYKNRGFWIGVYDPKLDGRYRYIDSSPLVGYAPWNNGEPNNYNGNEHCVMMYGNTGKWNDYGCRIKLPYVCRIDY